MTTARSRFQSLRMLPGFERPHGLQATETLWPARPFPTSQRNRPKDGVSAEPHDGDTYVIMWDAAIPKY